MAKYPEVQKKAQAELDLHVGPHRLPSIKDRTSLTYIRAIVLESLRWQPTAPLCIPHLVLADDEYNGYRIPKGTTILAVRAPSSDILAGVDIESIECLVSLIGSSCGV